MKVIAALSVYFLSVAVASPVAQPGYEITQRGTPTVERAASSVQESVSLCSQYAYYAANGYELLNNLWGKDAASSGSQCTYYEGTSGSGIKWSSTWSWQGSENNVKSYVYAGKTIAKGNTIARISSMPTQVQWNYNTTNNVRANVAYDIFTAADPNHSTSSGDYEVMIWLGRLGGVYPIGSKITSVNIAGQNFDLYYGPNGSMKVYSFVRSGNDITSFNADVKQFYTYLTNSQGFPASSQNLIVYQMGTEAFTGGPAKIQFSSFSASISV